MESRAKEEADKKAKEYIVNAIQRCAADHVSETTISVVSLPNDEMKGRIIGREGRNIRTIETLTGVDLIIDDTPEAVILSGFDPIRREVARIALEKLIVDGRIHPARIEEMVEKAQREVETMIKEEGEAAVLEVGVHGIHPELALHIKSLFGSSVLAYGVTLAVGGMKELIDGSFLNPNGGRCWEDFYADIVGASAVFGEKAFDKKLNKYMDSFLKENRTINPIEEIAGIEDNVIQTKTVFQFEKKWIGSDGEVVGELVPTGYIPTFLRAKRENNAQDYSKLFKRKNAPEKEIKNETVEDNTPDDGDEDLHFHLPVTEEKEALPQAARAKIDEEIKKLTEGSGKNHDKGWKKKGGRK